MKKINFIMLLCIASLSNNCLSDSIVRYVECFCSIIQLVTAPEKYDGKIITASGAVGFIGDTPLIYLTVEHARFGIRENAIQIEVNALTKESYRALKKYKGSYVEIYGKFENASFTVVSSVEKAPVNK